MNLKNYPQIPYNNQTKIQQMNQQPQVKKPGQTNQANQLNPANQVNQPIPQSQANRPNSATFDELFHRELTRQQEVKLSAHAEKRLKERNISLNQDDFDKINKAVQQAAAKGSRDSLILYRDMALITSVTNRTVVTAIDGKSMEDHVFTNIDSAVFIK